MAKVLGTAKSVLMCVFLALFVLLMNAGRVHAQAQTATISGTVTDASGAVLAGAKVEATNVDTSVSQSTSSDPQGRYKIPQLQVGTYNVQASLSGFQTVVHQGVTLAIGSSVIVDLSLPVGQVTQTVSVEAQVSRVETENSSVSTLVSPQQMRDLPLNGRNFEQLLTLAPGVATIAPAFNVVTGRLYGMMNNYSVSGSRPTGQMFLLDGTDIRDFWEHATGSGYGGTSLGVEAIGEFQVLTNSYSAQFGGNGAVMNAVSRSGTNDFHGGVYEFLRNSAFDALDAPDKAAGLTSPPPFKRNQFGGAIGGPIKKDKLFFFGNYEGLRQGLASTLPFNIPEPYMGQGQLPCYSPLDGTAINTINFGACPAAPPAGGPYPAVGTAANPVVATAANPQIVDINKLFALCTSCKPIASTQLVNGVPTAFAAGADLGGYFRVATAPSLIINEDYVLGRVDYTIGANDSLFGRYVIDDARVSDNPRDPMGIFPEKDFTRNQFVTITEKHIVSTTMVNSLRFGYTRNNENSKVQGALTDAQMSAVGLTYDPLQLTTTSPGELPRQDGQVTGFGTQVIGPDQNRPDTLIQSKFSGADDLVWTRGAHTLKIGGVVTRIQTNNLQTAYANGVYDLVQLNRQFYMLGLPLVVFAVEPGANNSTRYFREINVAPYFQDDWKVTPQLTLNLGFRYDFNTNPVGWAAGNRPLTTLVGSFLPPIGPVVPGSGNPVFTPVKHVFAHNPNAANFGPRFGFAWDPFKDHKTSIRGGTGLFFDPTAPRLYESGFIATPPAGFSLLIGPGFPDPFVDPCWICVTGVPGEFAGVDHQTPRGSPYQIQYNLNVQREIAPGTVLTVGYVGSVSRHLWTQGDINPPMCTTYPDCTALPQVPTSRPTASDSTYVVCGPGVSVTCPGTGASPDVGLCAVPTQTSCYGSGVQFPFILSAQGGLVQGDRINTAFGAMVQAHNVGSSGYNSLQVSLNRQFAHNLAGQVNYTYSHCIDNGSFASSLEEWAQLMTDRYNPRYDYGSCNFDVRHNFSANGLYALPFKGNRLVEGWQLSTIIGIHSGLPLNVYNGNANDPGNLGTQWGTRANYSFAPGCSPNHIIDKPVPNSPGTIQWFDTSCYEAQAPGFLGNIPRNSLPGPGTIGVDFSIKKETKIWESANLEFRAEFFNIINHFNPGGTSPNSGTVLGAINSPGTTSGVTTFSQSPIVDPRQIQFAVKFDF